MTPHAEQGDEPHHSYLVGSKKTLQGGKNKKNSNFPIVLGFLRKYDGALRIMKLVRIRPKPKLLSNL